MGARDKEETLSLWKTGILEDITFPLKRIHFANSGVVFPVKLDLSSGCSHFFDGRGEGAMRDGKGEHLESAREHVLTWPSTQINENGRLSGHVLEAGSMQRPRTVPGGHPYCVWPYQQLSAPLLYPLLTGRKQICITNCLNIQFWSTFKALFVLSSSNG